MCLNDGKVDHDGTESIFGQLWNQCKDYNPSYSMFIQHGVEARCWTVGFQGEASIDAGGPYRESLDNMAKELESDLLPLLIKSPNNRNDHGSNRDCFILNPSARSPTHLEMFKFFGALLSFHIGTKSPTPLHLAPSVWKSILGE
jgi:E3 ubiquitin-protein ligase HERC2